MLLEQIRYRAADEHPYFGRKQHIQMRQRVRGVRRRCRSARAELRGLSYLGYLELLYEKTPQRAIETLRKAYELLPSIQFPTEKERKLESNGVRFFLAVAYLRLGETENCCLRHSSESCILPIRGEGIHTQEEGSRQSMAYFVEVLKDTADSTTRDEVLQFHEASRWLLTVAP